MNYTLKATCMDSNEDLRAVNRSCAYISLLFHGWTAVENSRRQWKVYIERGCLNTPLGGGWRGDGTFFKQLRFLTHKNW